MSPRGIGIAAFFVLAGCGRTVPLRIGPADLATNVASYEVRVWQTGACPTIDAAASLDTTHVALRQSYAVSAGAGAVPAAVGEVPSGVHAVSVLARDAGCAALLFGCTPSVDFGSASTVDVVWSQIAPPFGCAAGETCAAGRCTADRSALDASTRD